MNATFIDTHCHLNFKRFNKTRMEVISEAQKMGVTNIIVPGTDCSSSQKAVDVVSGSDSLFAAVGIHPHSTSGELEQDMRTLEQLITHPKVVAVGEIGLDAHIFEDRQINIEAQKNYFIAQIQLAKQYDKSLIIHNRETKKELLEVLAAEWEDNMSEHTVFHCCEPDSELLSYALSHDIYIGIDGDVTYGGEKAQFAKTVPLELLVLETDSPFLLPEPLRAQKLYPNTPSTIPRIAQCVADIKGVSIEEVAEVTTKNAKRLFKLTV